MSRAKMIPPMPPKAPPPREAVEELKKLVNLHETTPRIRAYLDGVLLQFSQETEFLLMRPQAARKLAAKLIATAEEVEKKK